MCTHRDSLFGSYPPRIHAQNDCLQAGGAYDELNIAAPIRMHISINLHQHVVAYLFMSLYKRLEEPLGFYFFYLDSGELGYIKIL